MQFSERSSEPVRHFKPAPQSLSGNRCRSCPAVVSSPLSFSRSLGITRIVQDVMRSPGQPLGSEVKAFMEDRFGYDFSN